MIVSGEQWRDSAIHIHASILPQTPLPGKNHLNGIVFWSINMEFLWFFSSSLIFLRDMLRFSVSKSCNFSVKSLLSILLFWYHGEWTSFLIPFSDYSQLIYRTFKTWRSWHPKSWPSFNGKWMEKSGNSDRFYFLLLQNHCRQWLQPWN